MRSPFLVDVSTAQSRKSKTRRGARVVTSRGKPSEFSELEATADDDLDDITEDDDFEDEDFDDDADDDEDEADDEDDEEPETWQVGCRGRFL
jgi:hypothetical protein